jgi:hypothetical protein
MTSTHTATAKEPRCFACDRPLKPGRIHWADTRDGQLVHVGLECWRKIALAGDEGYQPPLGGPRLFLVPTTELRAEKRATRDPGEEERERETRDPWER